MAISILYDTDVEIRAQVALSTSPIFLLREIRVEREDQALILSGRVNSYYFKQVAQELVRTVAGASLVINRIEVD